MVKFVFRKLEDKELETAYKLHCERVAYMLKKGIRQWLKPIDFSRLEERQNRGENFGLFLDGELKVFLSLIKRYDFHEWAHVFKIPGTIWLNTVSVSTKSKHKGLGKIAVKHAIEYLRNNNISSLYLDCVINDGFLVNYYKGLGFELLAETTAAYRSGSFKMALMCLKIENNH